MNLRCKEGMWSGWRNVYSYIIINNKIDSSVWNVSFWDCEQEQIFGHDSIMRLTDMVCISNFHSSIFQDDTFSLLLLCHKAIELWNMFLMCVVYFIINRTVYTMSSVPHRFILRICRYIVLGSNDYQFDRYDIVKPCETSRMDSGNTATSCVCVCARASLWRRMCMTLKWNQSS